MTILFEYLGVDGSVWNLRTGPVRLGLGAQGVGLIGLTTFTQDNGARDGQRATGWKATAQALTLPLKKGYPGYSDLQYSIVDDAWTLATLPHKQGALRCTDDRGDGVLRQRTVPVRVTSDGPYTMAWDPSEVSPEDIDHTFLADVPWWVGPTQRTQYGIGGVATPFYGASGLGPPFYISPANSSGQQQVSNPGHVDAWGVWTLNGPVTDFTITQGGRVVSAAPNLAAGERLVLDTRPGAKSATRFAVDGTATPWTPNMTATDWRPIPAGSSAAVAVAITGTGGAELALAPLYFKPWGG